VYRFVNGLAYPSIDILVQGRHRIEHEFALIASREQPNGSGTDSGVRVMERLLQAGDRSPTQSLEGGRRDGPQPFIFGGQSFDQRANRHRHTNLAQSGGSVASHGLAAIVLHVIDQRGDGPPRIRTNFSQCQADPSP
jgi:hypothetical protein